MPLKATGLFVCIAAALAIAAVVGFGVGHILDWLWSSVEDYFRKNF